MRAALMILALVLSACGEDTMIVLEVHCDLSVPDQINGLEVALTSPVDGNELKRVDLTLAADHEFPIDVGFYPGDNTPTVLEGRVTGELDDVPVEQIEVRFDWQPGKLNRVELFPLESL